MENEGKVTTESSGALAIRPDQTDWTEGQRAALAQLGIADAPKGDTLVFLHVAQRMGLDPFNKEIYMIARWDPSTSKKKWTIQVGIDGFRARSEEHPQFAGVGDAEWCGPDGKWVEVWAPEEPPLAARFTVYRKDQPKPIRAVAHYREYVQTNSKGQPTQRWQNAPADQLAKCAEAKARRTAFPRQLGGVYAPEELQHLDNPQPKPMTIEPENETKEPPPDWDALVDEAEDAKNVDRLREIWDLARAICPFDLTVFEKIAAAGQRLRLDQLFALLREGGIERADRDTRLRIATRILNRPPTEPVTSFDQLTVRDTQLITDFLQQHKETGDLIHTCAELSADNTSKDDE